MGSEKFRHFSFLAVGFLFGLNSWAQDSAGSGPREIFVPVREFKIPFELSSPQVQDGSILVVKLHVPEKYRQEKFTAKFEETALPVYPAPRVGEDVFEMVVGVPYAHDAGSAKIQLSVGEFGKMEIPFSVVVGKYDSEQLKVAPGKVNPKKTDMKRINADIKEVSEIYRKLTPTKYWDGKFELPIHSSFTSYFGTKRMYNGERRSFHPGLDFKAKVGTEIHAPAGGIVALAKDLFFTGNTVMIDHGYGVVTLYAHMSRLNVKKGDIVKAQDLLGLSGMTGRVSGPHLHWGAIIHKQKVNPMDLTKVME